MSLPFDRVVGYYLSGAGFVLVGSWLGYTLTHSQFFLLTFVLALLAALFFLFFFRDPERKIPAEPKAIVAAADGKVLSIQKVAENDYLKSEAYQVIIFLSPLNVHINRAPVSGTVEWVAKSKGAHKPAFAPDAHQNEQNSLGIRTEDGHRFLVRQIVGTLARRILCRAQVGARLERGQRFGLIQFGSRTDIFVPITARITVQIGDRVKGGESIIGVLP